MFVCWIVVSIFHFVVGFSQAYKALGDDQKRAFVDAYDKAKAEGKHKDLEFARSFIEVSTNSIATSHGYKDDWFTQNQILKMNDLNPDVVGPDKAAKLLNALLQESADEFGHTVEKKEHASSLEELAKYHYVFAGPRTIMKETVDKSSFVATREMNAKMLADVGAGAAGIKIENPELVAVQKLTKDMVSAKTILQKHLNVGLDLLEQGRAMVKAGNLLQTAVDEFEVGPKALSKFLQDVRELLGIANCLDANTDTGELQKVCDRLKKHFDQSKQHDAAARAVIKSFKGKLV